MRTAAILSTLAALGCGEAEQRHTVTPPSRAEAGPTEAPQALPHEVRRVGRPEANSYEARTRNDCMRYSARPDFFGFCLYQVAQRGEGSLGAEHLCEGADTWETDCHDAWTIARARPDTSWTIDALLAACGSIDCRFEVLDFRPHPNITDQIQRCAEHTGRFGGDCAAHGMDRWLKGAPTEEEFNSIRDLEHFPDRIGHYMGLSVGCFNIGECGTGTGTEVDIRCNLTVTESEENPELCRSIRTPAP